jgi:hypothetical protein
VKVFRYQATSSDKVDFPLDRHFPLASKYHWLILFSLQANVKHKLYIFNFSSSFAFHIRPSGLFPTRNNLELPIL